MSRSWALIVMAAMMGLFGCIGDRRSVEDPQDSEAAENAGAIEKGESPRRHRAEPVTAENWERLAAAAGENQGLVWTDLTIGGDDSGWGGFHVRMLLPENAKVLSDPFETIVTKGSEFAIRIVPGRGDLEEMRGWIAHGEQWLVLDSLVFVRIEPGDAPEYRVGYWARLGHVDFFVENQTILDGKGVSHTRQQCLAMLNCARSLELKDEIPADPVAMFKRFGARTVERDGKVVELTLNPRSTTPSMLVGLRELPVLERLSLREVDIIDEDMPNLESLTGLHDLDLTSTRITDEGLKHLAGLSELERLEIWSHFWPRIDGSGLKYLAGLHKLKELVLRGNPINDDKIAALRGLEQLESLNLSGTRVTDAALADLSELHNLQVLNLAEQPITDAGVKHLAGLTQLKDLSLAGTRIGDAAMTYLEGLQNLERLEVEKTSVGDPGVEHLKGLTSLKAIWLGETKVTDEGVACLSGLANLETLSLRETAVTDSAVDTIRGFKKLDSLYLGGTGVTESGKNAILQVRPRLTLYWYPPSQEEPR